MLRQKYILRLRHFLTKEIKGFRAQSHLTQEQLSERLCMTPRSYVDLEHGDCGCSALTLMLFLFLLKDEEILQLTHSAKKALMEVDRHDVA